MRQSERLRALEQGVTAVRGVSNAGYSREAEENVSKTFLNFSEYAL